MPTKTTKKVNFKASIIRHLKCMFSKEKRFISFFIIGVILAAVYSLILMRFHAWQFLFHPFILIPFYFTNIIKNLGQLNILNADYFWAADFNIIWSIIFTLVCGIFYSLTFTFLFGKNKKVKKFTLWFLLIMFLSSLLLKTYSEFTKYLEGLLPDLIHSIGANNLIILLSTLTTFCMFIIILRLVNKEVNIKVVSCIFVKYSFTIAEVLLELFIGILFLDSILEPSANRIDFVSVWLYLFLLGFFIFLLLELTKKHLLIWIETHF